MLLSDVGSVTNDRCQTDNVLNKEQILTRRIEKLSIILVDKPCDRQRNNILTDTGRRRGNVSNSGVHCPVILRSCH